MYTPFNLVIRDITYYMSEVLGKPNWPAHFANFIGWIPVLLAVYALFRGKDNYERRVVRFLGVAAVLALWTSSAGPLEWLVKVIKIETLSNLLAGVRYTSFISSLAVPPILGLAAIGLDRLFDAWNTRFQFSLDRGSNDTIGFKVDPRVVLVVPLAMAVNQAKEFNSQWLVTVKLDPYVNRVVTAMKTDDLQWVNVPFGEHFFVTPAMSVDLKLSVDFFRTWHWKERPLPEPYLEANHHGPPAGMTELTVVEGANIHVATEGYEYAAVEHPDGTRTACVGEGVGGDVNVFCDTSQRGVLVVKENQWSGWRAEIDGEEVEFESGNWLTVSAPAGAHTYGFRYRPWDVKLGLVLLFVGILISGGWVFSKTKNRQD